MSVETFIAGRYLRAKRQESFISVIAGFSLVGIALGVATLIIVMSVMNGFRQELVGRILGINGHINVYSTQGALDDYAYQAAALRDVPGIKAVTPTIEGQALITYQGAASGVIVRGLTPEDFQAKELLRNSLPPAEREALKQGKILIGIEMARRLNLHINDVLTLISPKPKNTPFGSMPRSRAYKIGGTFDVGMFEYNNNFIFMPMDAAQGFFELPQRVSMLEVVLNNVNDVNEVKKAIGDKLGDGVLVRDWKDNNSSFFGALEVERNVMFLILTLIILVAAFNIISSLIMLVKDKSRDIAILRTMGATKIQILKIFLLTGASIGVAGTLFGLTLGLLITLNLGEIQHGLEALTHSKLFPAEVYFLTRLPAIVAWHEVLTVVLMSLALSFAATIYPAWRAAKLDPVEALRYA